MSLFLFNGAVCAVFMESVSADHAGWISLRILILPRELHATTETVSFCNTGTPPPTEET